jgi:hypothetical protein
MKLVVGELAPKTAAIQKGEAVTLLFAVPIIWFYKLMYTFIWLLNGFARALMLFFIILLIYNYSKIVNSVGEGAQQYISEDKAITCLSILNKGGFYLVIRNND